MTLGGLWGDFGRALGQSWGKLGQPWGKVGASWGRVVPKLGQVGAELGQSWGKLGQSWGKVGASSWVVLVYCLWSTTNPISGILSWRGEELGQVGGLCEIGLVAEGLLSLVYH